MNNVLKTIINQNPQRADDTILYFGNERDGDWFGEEDVSGWNNGRFVQNWNSEIFLENPSSCHLVREIVKNHEYIIDLACGPGMGLLPTVKKLKPDFPCIATDANGLVLSEWKKYLDENTQIKNMSYMQFSMLDMPFKSDSVQAYSSFIGISSTRSGSRGYDKVLSEIHRTLKNGGMMYTLESEWMNVSTILEVFDKIKQEPWSCFKEEQIAWKERYIKNGFEVVYEESFSTRYLEEDDNELGKVAAEYGVKIGLMTKAYIIKKP